MNLSTWSSFQTETKQEQAHMCCLHFITVFTQNRRAGAYTPLLSISTHFLCNFKFGWQVRDIFSNHRQNFFWYSKKMFKEMFPIKRQQNNGVEVHQQSGEQLMWLQLTSGSLWQRATNRPSQCPTRNLEMFAGCPTVGSEAGRNFCAVFWDSISNVAQTHLKKIFCNFFFFFKKRTHDLRVQFIMVGKHSERSVLAVE